MLTTVHTAAIILIVTFSPVYWHLKANFFSHKELSCQGDCLRKVRKKCSEQKNLRFTHCDENKRGLGQLKASHKHSCKTDNIISGHQNVSILFAAIEEIAQSPCVCLLTNSFVLLKFSTLCFSHSISVSVSLVQCHGKYSHSYTCS